MSDMVIWGVLFIGVLAFLWAIASNDNHPPAY